MNEITDTTALVPAEPAKIAALFASEDAIDLMVAKIEAEARSHVPDTSTAKGRKAITSLAYKVTRSKTALDTAGKDLNAEARRQIDAVDAQRRKIRDRLDALRDEVIKPLTEWEEKEAARVAKLESRMTWVSVPKHLSGDWTSEELQERIAIVESVSVDESWEEYQEKAAFEKDHTLTVLRTALEAARKREAEAAELARLRKEQAEREERLAEAQRIAAEAKAAAEKAEREKQEAEERAAKAERDRAEAAERAAKEEADRQAREQQAEREREQRIAREEAEAAERAEREAEERKAREEAAREAEAQAKAEAEEREKQRAARHQQAVSEAVKAITDLNTRSGSVILTAIIGGQIPHVTFRIGDNV